MKKIARKAIFFAIFAASMVIITSLQIHFWPIGNPRLAFYILWMRLATIVGFTVTFVLAIRLTWRAIHTSHELAKLEVVNDVLKKIRIDFPDSLHGEAGERT